MCQIVRFLIIIKKIKNRVNERLILGNFWHSKWTWFIIDLFRPISPYLEYFQFFIEKMTYGAFFPLNFCQRTQFFCQSWKKFKIVDFWNSLPFYLMNSKVNFKSLGFSFFFILTKKLCSLTKVEWEKCPISHFLNKKLKIFQIRRNWAKKVNNKSCPFSVSKVA